MRMIFSIAVFMLSIAIGVGEESSCDQEQAQSAVQRLIEARIIISIDPFQPNLTVVVDDAGWRRSSYDTKLRMARNIACAQAGSGSRISWVVFFRARNNTLLATYNKERLSFE